MSNQKKIKDGTQAENLMKNKNWEVMEDYISYNLSNINKLLTGGLRPDIEDAIIVKTAEQKYWEYVGKAQAYKDIERSFKRKIELKNKLLEKQDEKSR